MVTDPIRPPIRAVMLFEAAAFITAALVHFGVLIGGYGHRKAGTAESVIAAVLLAGAALTWIRPRSARGIGPAAQGFALLGTLVGIVMVAIGVGPRTPADVVYHAGMVLVLIFGLGVAARTRGAAR